MPKEFEPTTSLNKINSQSFTFTLTGQTAVQLLINEVVVGWNSLAISKIRQTDNQEFFRTGEFSWNKGAMINISSTKHQRKACKETFQVFFSPRYS